MKVNETISNVVIQKKVSQSKSLAKGDANNSGADGLGVAFREDSPKNLFLKKLIEEVHKEPEVRTELVQKFKTLIKSGEYKINPEELSSKILKESIKESQK
tara:strand:- start:2050 stop:2352 length:303 start_codon:yes stop_codon:yes gene_type:complete